MSTKPQIELFLENESGTQQVAYPFVESDHVSLSNGMDIDTMIRQDVSMPTVAHEDLSFKVGVGDQDVSSAIVDSSVAEMTIKGQTYQNILPEPSTHVLTNNKEMFKVNEGLDPNVEIVDGVSKSAILSGKTLVNMCDDGVADASDIRRFTHNYTSNGGTFEQVSDGIKATTTQDNTWLIVGYDIRSQQRKTMTIGKKYYGVADVTVHKLTNSDSCKVIFRTQYGLRASKSLTNGRGLVQSVFTHGGVDANQGWLAVGTDAQKAVVGDSFTVHSMSVYEITEEEANLSYEELANKYPVKCVGMTSCKMPALKTVGKNLFDITKFNFTENSDFTMTGNTINCNYTKSESSIRIYLSDLNLTPNTTYTLSANFSENVWLGGKINGDTYMWAYADNQTITFTPSNFSKEEHIVLKNIDNLTPATISNIQLEKGSVATSYEPYKSNILSCQLAPLNQSMFEQGTFAESTPPNTQSYESIKLGSEHLYTTRIRTKGTYKVVQGATYEVQLNDGYGIFVCYCKNGLYSATVNRWLDGTRLTFTVPNDCDEMFFALRKTDNSAITPSDYPLIGLKIHQEVVLRSLPNGVKDTLNLNTGEYVQRIGEVVLDGSENWVMSDYTRPNHLRLYFTGSKFKQYQNVINSRFPDIGNIQGRDVEGVYITNTFDIQVEHSRLSEVSVVGFKQWLSQNPITVQYQLKTESIKTVDLSSSGNWEKVVLDGKPSENWQQNSHSGNFVQFEGYSNFCLYSLNLPLANRGLLCDKLSYYGYDSGFRQKGIEGISDGGGYRLIFVRVKTEKLPTNDVAGFKQWLSQNPIEVSYMLSSNKDSTQVKQPIFFKDGHIQLSSGADHSLIPTLDYQAKTSNSYVMDLMKANTRYTMKAKTASGTFTIDGTSYGAGTNGTFTTPSSMTNKLLVMSNKTNEEVMILEGDVTSKTIPYFKGIKSAFEGEDKIEVLSTGKNLFNPQEFTKSEFELNKYQDSYYGKEFKLKPNTQYKIKATLKNEITTSNIWSVVNVVTNVATNEMFEVVNFSNGDVIKNIFREITFTTDNSGKIGFSIYTYQNGAASWITNLPIAIQLEEGRVHTSYESHKSNSTKIPLLSPLRSLPNGVKDEIIIDRQDDKIKYIQRVAKVIVDNSFFGNHVSTSIVDGAYCIVLYPQNIKENWDRERVLVQGIPNITASENPSSRTGAYPNLNNVVIWDKTVNSTQEFTDRYINTDVYYELATPIITEVDIEGFPYIYKDGHIFLNGEITPVTEIKYSINQQHQIEASNQDIMRHQKEIDYLYKLIGEYVRVDYKNTLLSLNLELK